MPPKIPPLPPEPLEAIEAAAADWLVLKDRGLTAAQQQDFARWLELDERHAEVFHALEAAWQFLRSGQRPVRKPPVPAPPTEGALLRFSRRRSSRVAAWATAAAAAIALAGWVWQHVAPTAPAARFRSVTATDVGALQRLDLPDGSLVQLNTNSAIEIVYGANERRVKLQRGEAHFTVEEDAQRPFIVTAGGVDVRAVGTAFNVRLRQESVDVLVTHGKVNIAPPRTAAVAPAARAPDTFLVAGQRTSIALAPALKPPPVISVPEVEIKQALAWQERRLDFDSAPLAEMVAEINRYNHHQLVIADARLEAQRFGGSFPAGDYTTFVRLLENNFGVIAERRDDETVLRLPQ